MKFFYKKNEQTKKVLGRNIKEIEEDDRYAELFRVLRERDVAENYADTQTQEHLTAEMLDSVCLLNQFDLNE